MVTGRLARMRGMDQDKFDLKTLTQHFEVHNRSEGKSAGRWSGTKRPWDSFKVGSRT